MNLKALNLLMPYTKFAALEINEKAAQQARRLQNTTKIHDVTIQNFEGEAYHKDYQVDDYFKNPQKT